MNFVIATVSLIPIFLIGDLLYRIFAAKYSVAISVFLRWPVTLAFGVGAAALCLFYISLIDTKLAFTIVIGGFIAVSVSYLVALILRRSDRKRMHFSLTHGVLLLAFSLFLLAVLWFVSQKAGLGHDGYYHWGIKAKASFMDGGWNLTREGLERFTHPSYPLLVPSQQAWIYTFLGEVDEGAVKIIFVLFYLALGSLFFHAVRREYDRLLAIFFTILMLSTPLLALTALSAYADVPMMFFFFGSVLFLTRWLDDGGQGDLLIGAIFAGLMLLVKDEAIVYWAVIFLFILGYYLHSKRVGRKPVSLNQMLLLPFVAILIAGSWFVFVRIAGIEAGSFETLSLSLLLERGNRLAVVAQMLLRELFLNFGAWGILWYLFVALLVWQRRLLAKPSVLLLGVSVVVPILLLTFSFVFSVWDDYTAHVETALSRLILHTAPLAWLFIAQQGSELQAWYNELRHGVVNES